MENIAFFSGAKTLAVSKDEVFKKHFYFHFCAGETEDLNYRFRQFKSALESPFACGRNEEM